MRGPQAVLLPLSSVNYNRITTNPLLVRVAVDVLQKIDCPNVIPNFPEDVIFNRAQTLSFPWASLSLVRALMAILCLCLYSGIFPEASAQALTLTYWVHVANHVAIFMCVRVCVVVVVVVVLSALVPNRQCLTTKMQTNDFKVCWYFVRQRNRLDLPFHRGHAMHTN